MTPLTASDRFPRTHPDSPKDCVAPAPAKIASRPGFLLSNDVTRLQPESAPVGIFSPQRAPHARRLPALRVPQRTPRYCKVGSLRRSDVGPHPIVPRAYRIYP